MTLYEFLKMSEDTYDTWDNVYDVEVTVDINTEPEDDYDEFCVALCKKINVLEVKKYWLICDWSDYIKRNMDVFRSFAEEYWWTETFDEDDDLICEWIEELHRFMAGCGDDDEYGWYKKKLVDSCK